MYVNDIMHRPVALQWGYSVSIAQSTNIILQSPNAFSASFEEDNLGEFLHASISISQLSHLRAYSVTLYTQLRLEKLLTDRAGRPFGPAAASMTSAADLMAAAVVGLWDRL